MRSKLLIFAASLLFLVSVTNAQTEDDWWEDDSWGDGTWEAGFDINVFYADSRPFIEANYGFSQFDHNLIGNNIFGNLNSVELKLGYSSIDALSLANIVEFEDSYFFISNVSKQLDFNGNNTLIDPELWRFGFAKRDGYGYKNNFLSFMPYHQSGINWSRLKITAADVQTFHPAVQPVLERFNEEFRFGVTNEAGIKLEFGEGFFGVNAGYETAVIFPRYLIWKHLGSYIIESAAQKAIDSFVDEVMESSPAAGPIVNFLLKNGLSYAFYTMKKEDMNWPFKTEEPLTMETFKVGIAFNF